MLKVLYAGSPAASAVTLKLLIENSKSQDFKIVGVLTNPPSAKGRHKDLIPTPVADTASENNIPVFTPEHLDSSARDEISKFEADILVCFAYGHIFGPKFLSMFSAVVLPFCCAITVKLRFPILASPQQIALSSFEILSP